MLGAFKKRGYTVAGQGKIYHPRSPPLDDSDLSWSSAFLPYPEWTQRGDPCPGDPPYDPFLERTQRPPQRRRRLDEAIVSDRGNGPACPVPRDHNITDAQIADLALENLAIVAMRDASSTRFSVMGSPPHASFPSRICSAVDTPCAGGRGGGGLG